MMFAHTFFYRNKYLKEEGPKPICCYQTPTYDCDYVILASITKEYQSRIEIYPNHDRFLLMSANTVRETLKSISIRLLGSTPEGLGVHASCSFLPELLGRIDSTIIGVKGLKLESFSSRQGLPIRAETSKDLCKLVHLLSLEVVLTGTSPKRRLLMVPQGKRVTLSFLDYICWSSISWVGWNFLKMCNGNYSEGYMYIIFM